MRFTGCLLILVCLMAASGCGTTRWTDTKRTATEQLLISDAIDSAVSKIDMRPLAGQTVYLDAQYLKDTVDKNYTTSVLRQHMLASGCRLSDKKEDADYVVEARAGVIGTSRHDLLYGFPSTDLSSLAPVPGVPNRIPEIPFVKKTEQQGSAKIAVFAYHRETGMPYWQSGNAQVESTAKDIWVLGIGPFERGTIRDRPQVAGKAGGLSRTAKGKRIDDKDRVWVAESLQFHTPQSIRHVQHLERQTRQASLPESPKAAKPPVAPKPVAPKPGPPKPPANGDAASSGRLSTPITGSPYSPPPAPPLGAATTTASRATINGVSVR